MLVAAAGIMGREGIAAATLARVAKEAGIRERTVRQLFGDEDGLHRAALAGQPGSEVAAFVADAARQPGRMPPLSVLVEAGHRLYAAPQQSWSSTDLQALVGAGGDGQMRDLARERISGRSANAQALVAQSAQEGALDAAVSEAALTHFTMVLSAGLAVMDPVVTVRPPIAEWDALITRIGLALAPARLGEGPEYEVSAPWRMRVDIPDRPGALSELVGALGALHVYTVEVRVDEGDGGRRAIYLALKAPSGVSPDVILAAASCVGTDSYITEGSPDDGSDILARTLDGATVVVNHPEEAPQVVGALVGADDIEVIDAAIGRDEQPNMLRLQWTADQHVLLHRNWGPFTHTEQLRASALLRLASALARTTGRDGPMGWVDEVRGGSVGIRFARPGDAPAVAEMHERCSDRTRYQRYFSLREWRDLHLRRLSGGHRGATLVVISAEDLVVGLGNVFPDPDAEPDKPTAEIALHIEDAHQGEGIGGALLARMLELAPQMGFEHVVAHVLADNRAMSHLLETTGLTWSTRVSEGVAESRAALVDQPGTPDRRRAVRRLGDSGP
ncbi:MAG TPA: GNAT family N-acetyltransferase [Motilibacterales bacterium]|nr:GNAT family N-acetyltransferase [Motilibacterales bacterium]